VKFGWADFHSFIYSDVLQFYEEFVDGYSTQRLTSTKFRYKKSRIFPPGGTEPRGSAQGSQKSGGYMCCFGKHEYTG
jgi:hypothetical protein